MAIIPPWLMHMSESRASDGGGSEINTPINEDEQECLSDEQLERLGISENTQPPIADSFVWADSVTNNDAITMSYITATQTRNIDTLERRLEIIEERLRRLEENG